jgi:hypothetical protein
MTASTCSGDRPPCIAWTNWFSPPGSGARWRKVWYCWVTKFVSFSTLWTIAWATLSGVAAGRVRSSSPSTNGRA